MKTLFKLEGASVQYDSHTVLSNLTLSIKEGEKVALVGPSSAGKSSLLQLLFSQKPDCVAWCPQSAGLVSILSVYHNIYMGQLEQNSTWQNLWNLAFPITKHRNAIKEIAQELGLNEKMSHSVDRLSGGQQQRVAIGRALYRQQPTFLGDEPVSSLDQVQSQQILSSIISRHKTVIVALHDVSLAVNLFDRVIGLKNGSIEFDLPVNQVNDLVLNLLYEK
jgi:phosphonate transport system ATP-binding protein